MKELKLLKEIALEVNNYGGRMYFVGGFVRDKLLGVENKDIDVEVFGVSPEKLKTILSNYGEVDEIGASFGILMIKGVDIDFAMPRTERKTGNGHRDFEISIDPNLSLLDATKRRDFTINTFMEDIITGEIIDLWNGKEDLANKTIRHIDDSTFIEDPLRVLRACQFASRFNFTIDENTLSLCKKIDINNLAKERVFEELKKALLKSDKSSIFFNYLYKMEKLDYFFKEIKDLKGVPQSVIHHPEGDVWNHTLLVIDECSKLKEFSSNKLAFMLSGLSHDLGKVVTTKIKSDGKITAIGHELESIDLSINLLSRLTNDKKIIEYVTNMAKLHMRPNMLSKNNSSLKASRRMFNESINPKDLILLAKADHLGRTNSEDYTNYECWLNDRLSDFYNTCNEPLLKGRDLIKMGLKPSKEFKEILDKAFNLQMSGLSKDEIIRQLHLKKEKA